MSSKKNNEYDSIIEDVMNDNDSFEDSFNESYNAISEEDNLSHIDEDDLEEDNDLIKNIDEESLKALNNSKNNDPDDSLFEQFDNDDNDDNDDIDYSLLSLSDNEEYSHRFNKLKELSSREDVSEDVDDIIQKQLETNRNINLNRKSNHIAVNLLDEQQEEQQFDDKAGDEKRLRIITFGGVGLAIFSVLALFTIPAMMSHNNQEVAENKPQDLNIGEIIGENNNANNTDNSNTDTNSTDSSEEVDIPEDGKKISYEITTSGDIQSASVAWVNGVGEAEDKTGVSIPWNLTVGAKKNVNPVLAASTNGEGTVTCTIKEDDKEIATKSSSGKSPEVTCGD